MSDVKVSNDYFALFAEKEIMGTATKSTTAEANALSQIEYYKVARNRKKYLGDSIVRWYFRGPSTSRESYWCCANQSGESSEQYPSVVDGIAPFGCI